MRLLCRLVSGRTCAGFQPLASPKCQICFCLFVFFHSPRKEKLSPHACSPSSRSSNVGGVFGFSENSCPLPPGLGVFLYFCFVICFIFRCCLAGRGQRRRLVGADESRWRDDPSSSSSAVNRTSGTDSPRLANVEAARPSPLPTSVSYTQSPADFGLNIPPAALNTAGCLPL